MKKISIRFLALALAVCLVLTLGACGGSNNNSKADNTDSTPGSSAVVDNAPTSGKPATVADLLNTDEMKSGLEDMKAQFGDTGAALDITGEGNSLVYTFIYDDLGGQDVDTISTALEGAMEQMASVFETIAGSLADQVEQANPTVKVIYKTSDGTELFSGEYSAN